MSCLPTNPDFYDKLLHVDASKRPSSIPYWPFNPLQRIYRNNTTAIEENDEHHLDFRPTLTWFFRFWLIFGVPFARLLGSFDVIFINPRLVTSNNTFDECRVISYVGKHLFCDLYSTFFLQKIQVLRYESGGDMLDTQKINHNVLSRSIRDVGSLCCLSNANTTIFEHNFLHFFDVIVVNRGGWMTRMRKVFNDLTTLIECFMPIKYLRFR